MCYCMCNVFIESAELENNFHIHFVGLGMTTFGNIAIKMRTYFLCFDLMHRSSSGKMNKSH